MRWRYQLRLCKHMRKGKKNMGRDRACSPCWRVACLSFAIDIHAVSTGRANRDPATCDNGCGQHSKRMQYIQALTDWNDTVRKDGQRLSRSVYGGMPLHWHCVFPRPYGGMQAWISLGRRR